MAVIHKVEHTIITIDCRDRVAPSHLGESLINLGNGIHLELGFATKEQRDRVHDLLVNVMLEISLGLNDD